MPYLMIKFYDTLTSDIVSFEQLVPNQLYENNYLYERILIFKKPH